MTERKQPGAGSDEQSLLAEIARQNKVIRALANRAERSSMDADGSDFGAFQTAIMLEEQVRRRTEDLEKALRDNEKITRALRESEARFRSVVNQPLVGIAIIENDKFTFTNPKFGEIFGYSAEELLTLGLVDMAIKENGPVVADHLRRRIGGDVTLVDFTFCGRRKDGAEVDIELHSSVMGLDAKPVLVTVVMDISERMRAEREMQALYDLLREQSVRDALTGLYNRRYLDATLEREMILAQRNGTSVSVVMCDFDRFKAINDQYGHLAGDEVLRSFAGTIMKHSRGSDIACRYGGEEFLLVMPGMPEANARARAEQLRAVIEATPIKHGDSTIAVTASFGVASFPQGGKNSGELLAVADKALYAAKRGGRNQVRSMLDLRPDGSDRTPDGPASTESQPVRQSAA